MQSKWYRLPQLASRKDYQYHRQVEFGASETVVENNVVGINMSRSDDLTEKLRATLPLLVRLELVGGG